MDLLPWMVIRIFLSSDNVSVEHTYSLPSRDTQNKFTDGGFNGEIFFACSAKRPFFGLLLQILFFWQKSFFFTKLKRALQFLKKVKKSFLFFPNSEKGIPLF